MISGMMKSFIVFAFALFSFQTHWCKAQNQKTKAEYLAEIRKDNHTVPIDRLSECSVILYGQCVVPPYDFTIDSNVLYLNGTRIIPPVVPPWVELKVPVVTETARQLSALTVRIRMKYAEYAKSDSGEELRNGVLRYIQASEVSVSHSEWMGDEDLNLTMQNGMELSMGFSRLNPNPTNEAIVKSLKQSSILMEAVLQDGGFIAIGYGPILYVPDVHVEATKLKMLKGISERSQLKLRNALYDDELIQELLYIQ